MSDEKPENGSAVKPQVIDLEAEDVTSQGVEASEEVEHPQRSEPLTSSRVSGATEGGSRRIVLWAGAALVVGLLAGGWLYRDVLSGYLPSDDMTAMKTRLEVLEANGKTLSDQLAAVARDSEAAVKLVSGLDEAVKTTAAELSQTATRLDSQDTRTASAENALKAAQSELEALRSAMSSAGTQAGDSPVDGNVVAALNLRLDTLEKDVASLKSATGKSDRTSVTTALSQALADLKAKVASGAAFAAEQDRISRMVPAATGLDVLASHAAAGLPSAAGLAAELRSAITALPQPEAPAPEDDSYWGSLLQSLSGIITIREIGEADWPQLAEKAAAFAEAGDLNQAIGVIDAAEGAKPPSLSQWRERAASRLRLEAAVDQVSEAVLRQIGALEAAQ